MSSDGRSCVRQCASTEYISLDGKSCSAVIGSNVQVDNGRLVCISYYGSYVIRLDGKDCTPRCGVGEVLTVGQCFCASGLVASADGLFCICPDGKFISSDNSCVDACPGGSLTNSTNE